ncbi:hypothetical protein OIU76_006663 [Salix suchowensis]|nr:hypothetical protein OIU76_006663 [Salix suchowensis]
MLRESLSCRRIFSLLGESAVNGHKLFLHRMH